MNHQSQSVQGYSIKPGDNFWRLAEKFNVPIHNLLAMNPGVNPYHLFIGQNIFIPIVQPAFMHSRNAECISPAELELKSNMRSLWEEHVAWTRMAIISLIFNLPDVNEVLTRLLRNATDMGDLLKPLYGNQLGDRFAELIKEHLLIAADFVKAALAGDQQAASEAETKWYANADEVSAFLSEINPFLSEKEFKQMFSTHLELTKTEAVLMINKEYQKDIEIYDEIEEQALMMGDMISDTIVKQFPNVF
ncbi:LysM domain-containing protein [Halobacillus sp. Marseille-Q1614]|uniref:LysM peptidoglycan-binding domain-containing protein n=1 Tax=Halobacillus sp. Marseille-Q1614 TaxID=2709134 RepID=UPI00156F6CB3|nr:LysM domain-containing protein [Halobacillus sp. Marseille-Q1614]